MRQTVTLTISQDDTNRLERANYEIEARVGVIAFMIAQNMDTTSTSFKKYQEELIELKKSYEDLKSEFSETIVKSYLEDHQIPAANWSIDFKNSTMTLDYDAPATSGNMPKTAWNASSATIADNTHG